MWDNEGHMPIMNSIAVMIDSLASIVLDCFTRFQSSRVHQSPVLISTYFPVVILFIFQHTPVLNAGFFSVGRIQDDASHSFECATLQCLHEEIPKHGGAEGYFDLTFFILSATKKYHTLMCRVLFELEDFPFSASRIVLLLSWYIVVVGT